jgi:hypothetical protein
MFPWHYGNLGCLVTLPAIPSRVMKKLQATAVMLLGTFCADLWVCGAASAQSPETVHWNTSVTTPGNPTKGSGLVLKLSGDIAAGWHVYAMTQKPGGPNALRINLDDNQIVDLAGAAQASPPHKQRDPRFGMVTQFYEDTLVLSLPVKLKQHAPTGTQQVPVSVRLQSCSSEVCLPPTTIHLNVTIDVAPTA